MSSKKEDFEAEQKGVYAALCRAALKAKQEDRFQFERHSYFVADKKDSMAGKPVFNRTVTPRGAWQK